MLPDGLPDQWESHLLCELDLAAHVTAGRVRRCPICPPSLAAPICQRTAGWLPLPRQAAVGRYPAVLNDACAGTAAQQ